MLWVAVLLPVDIGVDRDDWGFEGNLIDGRGEGFLSWCHERGMKGSTDRDTLSRAKGIVLRHLLDEVQCLDKMAEVIIINNNKQVFKVFKFL